MNKSFIITFSVSLIIFATVAVIMLMLLLPKQLISLQTSVEKYQQIEKSNYTYTKTKDISKEALLKEYKVSNENISQFRYEKKYIPGNSDPFVRTSGTDTSTNTNNDGTSSGASTSGAQTAIDKTTNSNGGVSNPESSGKG